MLKTLVLLSVASISMNAPAGDCDFTEQTPCGEAIADYALAATQPVYCG